MPTKNENTADRLIRLAVGLLLTILGLTMVTGWIQIMVLIVAAIALATALTGFCLLYKLLGIKTR